MAIVYNLVMSNRRRHPVVYVCFGLLNQFRDIGMNHMDTLSPFFKGDSYHKCFKADPSKLVAVEFNYKETLEKRNLSESLQSRIVKAFLEELGDFLEAFPWASSITTVNKRLEVVRVQAKGVPADKIIIVLMAIRNLLNKKDTLLTTSNPHTVEKEIWKKERFPNYRSYWVYTNLTDDLCQVDWDSGGNKKTWMSYPRFNDESNVLNAATFGRRSLKSLLRGEEPDWHQEFFENTYEGYCRDEHYSEFSEPFGTEEILWNVSEDYPEELGGCCSHRFLYRTLADSLSIEWDRETIFQNQYYDDYVGFVYDETSTLEQNIKDFLKGIEE